MSGLVLKPLTLSHVEAAYAIERACFVPEAAATLDAIRFRAQRYPEYCWGAWLDGQLVGITNGVLTNANDTGEDAVKGEHNDDEINGVNLCVLSVAVDAAYRHRGIGSKLITCMLEAANANRLSAVMLMCEAPLIPLYERLGFTHQGVSSSRHAGIEWHEMIALLDNNQA